MEFVSLSDWCSAADELATHQPTRRLLTRRGLQRKRSCSAWKRGSCSPVLAKEAGCSWEDGEGFVLKRCGGWPREWVWQMFFVILQHMGLPFPPSLGKILWHRHTCPNGPCLTSVWLQMGTCSFVDLRSLNTIKTTGLAAHAGRRGAGHSWSAK